MPTPLRALLPWLAVLASSGAVIALLVPGSVVDPMVAHQDKLGHLALFGALGVLWRLAGIHPLRVVLGLALLAVATECLQALMALGRHGDPVDAVVDLVGAILGVLVVPARAIPAPAAQAREPAAPEPTARAS